MTPQGLKWEKMGGNMELLLCNKEQPLEGEQDVYDTAS